MPSSGTRGPRKISFSPSPPACSWPPQASHCPVWVSRRMGSTLVTPRLPVPIGQRHANPTSPPFAGARVSGADDDILHKVPSQVLHFPQSYRIGDMGIPLLHLCPTLHGSHRVPIPPFASPRTRAGMKPSRYKRRTFFLPLFSLRGIGTCPRTPTLTGAAAQIAVHKMPAIVEGRLDTAPMPHAQGKSSSRPVAPQRVP